MLPGMDDQYNANLHPGTNGRVLGKAPPNLLVVVGFLSGTATIKGKAGIVTTYHKKKAEKAALDPAKVLLFLISKLLFSIFVYFLPCAGSSSESREGREGRESSSKGHWCPWCHLSYHCCF